MTAADDDGERLRRVRLANIRQELLAPASALVGYGEMLHEGAARYIDSGSAGGGDGSDD